MIDANDKDVLNISLSSYDETVSQYYTFYKEIKNLKTTIEDEIHDINKSSIRLFTQMNKFFNYKRYCINKTQKELKADFHKRINKIKEELQHSLIKSNDIISSLDKIGSEIFDFNSKKKESHLIKIWCYTSEINKYNEKANDFINELKRTLLFSFDESKIDINYSNYYFSGLPIPEDIIVEKIEENKIEISWKNDENKIKDINDRNDIKYKIKIKNNKNRFSFETKETKEKKLILDILRKDNKYQVVIRTILNDSESSWSKIKEFKVDELLQKFCVFGTCYNNLLTNKKEIKKENVEEKSATLFSGEIKLFG